MNVVGPTVQKDDRRTVLRTRFGIPNAQKTRFDLLEWPKRGIRADQRVRGAETTKLRSGKGHCGCAKEAATTIVEILGHLSLSLTKNNRRRVWTSRHETTPATGDQSDEGIDDTFVSSDRRLILGLRQWEGGSYASRLSAGRG